MKQSDEYAKEYQERESNYQDWWTEEVKKLTMAIVKEGWGIREGGLTVRPRIAGLVEVQLEIIKTK